MKGYKFNKQGSWALHRQNWISSITEEILDREDYRDSAVLFENMLHFNSKYLPHLSQRGKHGYLDVHYNPQSWFDISKQNKEIIYRPNILPKQALKDVRTKYWSFNWFNMSYDEPKKCWRENWEKIEMHAKMNVEIIFLLTDLKEK